MTRSMLGRAFSAVVAVVVWTAACGNSHQDQQFTSGTDGGKGQGSETGTLGGGDTGMPGDGGTLGPDGAPVGGDASSGCGPTVTDLSGCNCPTAGTTRPCYPNNVDPKSAGVGTCKQGTQTCTSTGEFGTWGACTGAVTPTTESCTGTVDSNPTATARSGAPTRAARPIPPA